MTAQAARILSTRPLDPALAQLAAGKGIALDALSFIAVEPIADEELGREIAGLSREPLIAVFTSMNAVEAVAHWLGIRGGKHPWPAPHWNIFCIGSATRQGVQENFGESRIAGTAGSAGELADSIIRQWPYAISRQAEAIWEGRVQEVVFFCGDQRRDELPDKLRKAGIRVRELVVYATARTPHKVEQPYDGIVFFSPSAVNSFFSNNTPPAGALLFAIGHTTADAIRSFSANTVIISGTPDKEALIRQAIEYFQKPI